MTFRRPIPDFQLANPLYTGATVFCYQVDTNGVATTSLATLYAGPRGAQTTRNPIVLDGEGKFSAPVYIDGPIVMEIVSASVGTHGTGITLPLGRWRGNWTTATAYTPNDFVRNGDLGSIYVVNDLYVSGATLAADVTAERLDLLFDVDNINIVAGIQANITTVAGIAADIPVAAALGPVSDEIAILAPISANITTVAGIAADIPGAAALAPFTSEIALLAPISGNITTVAGNIPTIQTVAENIADIQEAADLVAGVGTLYRSYDNRGDLRGIDGPADKQALVEGLGLFVWVAGSDQPDDDETAFASATGVWLLEAAAWDVAFAYWLPDVDVLRTDVDVLRTDVDGLNTILLGTATCSLSSVSTVQGANFTATIAGVEVGDPVSVNPPGPLETSTTGRLTHHAWVSAADTVTIRIVNPSASTGTLNAAVTGASNPWRVAVFKGVA